MCSLLLNNASEVYNTKFSRCDIRRGSEKNMFFFIYELVSSHPTHNIRRTSFSSSTVLTRDNNKELEQQQQRISPSFLIFSLLVCEYNGDGEIERWYLELHALPPTEFILIYNICLQVLLSQLYICTRVYTYINSMDSLLSIMSTTAARCS